MDKLGKLKEKKNILLEQKNKIENEKPSKLLKIFYILGIGVTAVFSSVVFLNKTPSLIFCITYLYTVCVPVFYSRNKMFKIWEIDNKLSDIQREIDYIDKTDYIAQIKIYDDVKNKKCLNNVILGSDYEECYSEEMVDDGPKLKLKM